MISRRWFVYHPFSYGVATLARIGVRFRGHQYLIHVFKPQEPKGKFHDHPWAFTTYVLWGGYTDQCLEERVGEVGYVNDRLMRGDVRYRAARHCHRMLVERWTVTLVHTFPRERDWCEGVPGAWECDGDADSFDQTLGMHPEEVRT